MITVALFATAAMGNLTAMAHKYARGTGDWKTYTGHCVQFMSLVGTAALAGSTGRNEAANGSAGLLSTLLPTAIKSYAYLSRDVLNFVRPLQGNHDAGYQHPVRAQALDNTLYFGNQFGVNMAQGASDWSATSFIDAAVSAKSTPAATAKAVLGLMGYVFANVGGEGVDGLSGRALAEISTHGFTGKAIDELKTLRVSWGKLDTSERSAKDQYFDKMAGPQIARLSLFLSLYAATAVINHAISARTDWSPGKQAVAENALGALLIIAGCLPFAASTSSPSRGEPEQGEQSAAEDGQARGQRA
jgi:hypothetical protein